MRRHGSGEGGACGVIARLFRAPMVWQAVGGRASRDLDRTRELMTIWKDTSASQGLRIAGCNAVGQHSLRYVPLCIALACISPLGKYGRNSRRLQTSQSHVCVLPQLHASRTTDADGKRT